jgi:pyruvate decarboxylase
MTTFGVSELSAINTIAGSFAEHVPVVHIAGSPSTKPQRGKELLHHTLGNGDYTVFADIYWRVTVAQANLPDIKTATKLRQCWIKKLPVYIELPTSMVTVEVDASPLETPLDLLIPVERGEAAISMILKRLSQTRRPILLIDDLIKRFHLESATKLWYANQVFPLSLLRWGKVLSMRSSPIFMAYTLEQSPMEPSASM